MRTVLVCRGHTVAIPGVYPESRPLSGAHRANFLAGKDNGVQLHIDGEKIRLGSAEANEALAIASRVEAELNKIITAFNTHVYASNGVATQPSITPTSDIATQKVVAEQWVMSLTLLGFTVFYLVNQKS